MVRAFSDFVYLFSEDSLAAPVEEVPDGVAAAVDGVLAVPVATDAGPVRVCVELHDRVPLPLGAGDGEDVAVLAWRPAGRLLTLGDTSAMGMAEKLRLGDGNEVLAVEIRCCGRDEASRAGAGELRKPAEEITVRLWPGLPSGGASVTRRSGFARALAGEPSPPGGPAAPLALGETVAVPASYHGIYLRDEGAAAPREWREAMVLASARVNGLVTNLPGLARVEVGTQFGEVDVRVRVARPGTVAAALAVAAGPSALPSTADAVAVTHHTSGSILVTDVEENADHYRFTVPAGEAGLLVVAWDRDKAARRRRNATSRERVDLVFWAGESPGEQVVQARSAFGRQMAADAEGIREQLARE